MAAANAPITMKEALTLTSIGINQQFITFANVTMESDKYICVRETAPQNSVVIIDMSMPNQPLRMPITADSALMNPNTRILALRAQLPGTTQDHLQIFNIEAKAKMKSYQMPEQRNMIREATAFLLDVLKPNLPEHAFLQTKDIFYLTPNLNVSELVKAFAVKTNDMMMLVVYLSSLIRSVNALHNLINNKILNKEHEKAEDSNRVAAACAAAN